MQATSHESKSPGWPWWGCTISSAGVVDGEVFLAWARMAQIPAPAFWLQRFWVCPAWRLPQWSPSPPIVPSREQTLNFPVWFQSLSFSLSVLSPPCVWCLLLLFHHSRTHPLWATSSSASHHHHQSPWRDTPLIHSSPNSSFTSSNLLPCLVNTHSFEQNPFVMSQWQKVEVIAFEDKP